MVGLCPSLSPCDALSLSPHLSTWLSLSIPIPSQPSHVLSLCKFCAFCTNWTPMSSEFILAPLSCSLADLPSPGLTIHTLLHIPDQIRWMGPYLLRPIFYLCLTRLIISSCVLPARFLCSTGLLRTLPLSRYLAATSHYATRHSSLLLCTDFPTHTFHSPLSLT